MPYGTSAPGNVFPPPLLQVRVSTSDARSLGDSAEFTAALSRAPAGSWLALTGRGQFSSRPVVVTEQVPVPVVAVGVAAALVDVVVDVVLATA
jgi:hypothetical protein